MKRSNSTSKTTNLGKIRLTFGIHEGKKLDDVPLEYIEYLIGLKNCPDYIKEYHRENKSYLKLTEDDKKISKAPKHPFHKGLFTKEAQEFLKLSPKERKKFEETLLIKTGVDPEKYKSRKK